MEFLLSTSISWNIFFSIAGQVKKLPLIRFDRLVALDEVAKLCLLPVNCSLRNVARAEGSLEINPGDDCSRALRWTKLRDPSVGVSKIHLTRKDEKFRVPEYRRGIKDPNTSQLATWARKPHNHVSKLVFGNTRLNCGQGVEKGLPTGSRL